MYDIINTNRNMIVEGTLLEIKNPTKNLTEKKESKS